MIVNLGYLNKLVDKYKNSFHHSNGKISIDADYSALTEEIETKLIKSTIQKSKKFDTVRITRYKSIFSKGYTKNWSREKSIIDSVLKSNPWTYKIKDSHGEKITGSFF